MSATQIATVHVEGLHNQAAAGAEVIGTIAFRDITGALIGGSGHVSPNLKTLKLGHSGEIKKIRGQRGLTTGLLANDEMLECTFDFVMEGTSRANARLSGRLPELLCVVDIASLPVIIQGTFTDALNASSGGAVSAIVSPWIYEGEGSISGESEDVWSGSLTLRRYKGIPTWSIIT